MFSIVWSGMQSRRSRPAGIGKGLETALGRSGRRESTVLLEDPARLNAAIWVED